VDNGKEKDGLLNFETDRKNRSSDLTYHGKAEYDAFFLREFDLANELCRTR